MCWYFRKECIFVIKCALTPQCAYMCVIDWVLTLHCKQEILWKEVFVSCEGSCEVIWNLMEKQIIHAHLLKYLFSTFQSICSVYSRALSLDSECRPQNSFLEVWITNIQKHCFNTSLAHTFFSLHTTKVLSDMHRTLNICRHYSSEMHVRTQIYESDDFIPRAPNYKVWTEYDLCYITSHIAHSTQTPPYLTEIKQSFSHVRTQLTQTISHCVLYCMCERLTLHTMSGPDSLTFSGVKWLKTNKVTLAVQVCDFQEPVLR